MAPPVQVADDGDVDAAGQLLITVVGDYWFAATEHIAAAALVAIMAEFGVSEDAVRAALSRLCRDGRLERVKDGRRTAYRLSPEARDRATERGRRLVRYGAQPVDWDGQWTCVAFSVPEADRHLRSSFRNRLRTLGMGALFDGLWVSPHPILDTVDRHSTSGHHPPRAARHRGPGARRVSPIDTMGPGRAAGRLRRVRARSRRPAWRLDDGAMGQPRHSSCAPT